MVLVTKRIRLLAGGIILNMVAGNLNNWGTLYPYVASNFFHSDSSLTTADFSIVPFYTFVSESLSTVLISYLASFMSLHRILSIFVTLFCIMMFCSSFILNPYIFTIIFGISLGSLAASIFLPSLWIIWEWLPENKPVTSGILLTGYSLGPIPFSILFTLLVNPQNYQAVKVGNDYMFEKNVADKVPAAIQIFSIVLLATSWIGLLLLPWEKKVLSNQSQLIKENSIYDLSKSFRFWNLFFMMMFSMCCQGYAQTMYKVIAIKFINDDYYSTYVGMCAFFVGGVGRGTFGYLINKFYWKKVMSFVYIAQIILMSGLWFTIDNKVLYGFFIVFYNFTIGSLYNNVLLLTENEFTGDKKVISFVCLSFIISLFIPYLMDKMITPFIGYFLTFVVVAGFSFILLAQTAFYKEKLPKKVY